jgi:ATP-dependent Lon protease
VGRPASVKAVEAALHRGKKILLLAQRDGNIEEPEPSDLYSVGSLGRITEWHRDDAGNFEVGIETLHRASVSEFHAEDEFLEASVRIERDVDPHARAGQMLARHLLERLAKLAELSSSFPGDALDNIRRSKTLGFMADLAAGYALRGIPERQKVLEAVAVLERLETLISLLDDEIEVLEVEQRIRQKVRRQVDRNQKEFWLREQLKAIHEELGTDLSGEIEELRKKAEAKRLPQEVADRVFKEISRLERMPQVSPEGTVARTYIDLLLSLPWTERTEDRLDLALAKEVLDADHYGLQKVKDRILEFLAVYRLTLDKAGTIRGPILCLVGPPGVGKTSLGQSIARALNRRFVRISLGGVRDEAEIRGHRRTYVGALPGRIIQAMRTAGTVNPVIMLDEIDKLGSDFRGDPGAALLEVLDPEQNHAFVDHYVELPYDLSSVMFITTANSAHAIPKALLDRMEVIEIGGYSEDEKVQIARRHLLPKQLRAHGIDPRYIEISDRMFRYIINNYTHEAGVRGLERRLAAICRKAAKQLVEGRTARIRITPHKLIEYLGPPRHAYTLRPPTSQIGVALGMAWTEYGGDILPVEVISMPGKDQLITTGRLGDVLQESARAALSYARSKLADTGEEASGRWGTDFHIHLPEGAIPKDGPSAGLAIAVALISAMTRRPVRNDIAMTGEITLTGRVLPVGGLKEKILAAHRSGLREVIVPKDNAHDLVELPPTVRKEMRFHLVETVDEAAELVLLPSNDAISVHSWQTTNGLSTFDLGK